jgi:hypothetical protein
MVKSVLTQKLVPVDYDNNGTFDLGFFQPIAGSPLQGQLGVWLLGQSSDLFVDPIGIGNVFPYGEPGWVPGFIGETTWFLNGSSLLSPDFNGDGKTDQIFGRPVFADPNDPTTFQGYRLATWLMDGDGVLSYKTLVNSSGQVVSVNKSWGDPSLYNNIGGRGSLGDFNGDNTSDLLFLRRNSDETTTIGLWLINNGVAVTQQGIGTFGSVWSLANTNDFDGSGTTDLLFTRTTESGGTRLAIWTLNGTEVLAKVGVDTARVGWQIFDTNDFSGDGKADILWTRPEADGSTRVALWVMNGTQVAAYKGLGVAAAGWSLIDHNDFNGDNRADLLFTRTINGQRRYSTWLLDGANDPLAYRFIGSMDADSDWEYYGSGDANGDGTADILFYNEASREMKVWQLGSNGQLLQEQVIGTVSGDWRSPFLLDPLGPSGFSGDYAPANWTLANTTSTNGFVDTDGTPDQLTLYGGNFYGDDPRFATQGTTTYTINSGSTAAVFSFNWAFGSEDEIFQDFFTVMIGGTATVPILADIAGQTGSFSQLVAPNTEIGFLMGTTDNRYGAGYVTITDFNVSPVLGSF